VAVVINEFEVIPEPPPEKAAPAKAPAGPPPEQAALTPLDLENLVRRRLERAARVRAH
jgi:hypothetical protein